jgi:hypothetical protein
MVLIRLNAAGELIRFNAAGEAVNVAAPIAAVCPSKPRIIAIAEALCKQGELEQEVLQQVRIFASAYAGKKPVTLPKHKFTPLATMPKEYADLKEKGSRIALKVANFFYYKICAASK